MKGEDIVSIYIVKDNEKKKVNISATDVQLLDIDGKFKSKNLEDAMKEVGSGTEENMLRIEEKVNGLSNPNLLINGDFQVWSKGTIFNTSNYTNGYVADRWRYDVEGADKSILQQYGNGGMMFQLISNKRVWINQLLELNTALIKQLKTSPLTLSFDVISDVETSAYVEVHDGITTLYKQTYSSNDTLKRVTMTFNVGDLTGKPHLSIAIYRILDDNKFTVENNKWIRFENVKLEFGSIATPFKSKPYVQELQDCLMYDGDKLTTPYSNPNLLINGDFRVWQRGESIEITKATQYTADRWCVYRSNYQAGGTVSKWNKNELLIRPSSLDYDYFISQTLDEDDTLSIRGKTLTLSMRVRKSNAISVNMGVSYVTSGVVRPGTGYGLVHTGYKDITNEEYYDSSLTFTVPTNATSICVYASFKFYGITAEDYASVNWVKLEQGTVATPFIPRTYAEELVMCQRYYEVVYHTERLYNNVSASPHGYELKTPFKARKRIKPTLTVTYSKTDNDLAHEITTWVNDDCCYNYFTGYLHPTTNSALTIGKRISYQGTADSEIY